ncbi:hypothetical protein HOD08_00970 [bacterium]|jgi:hypothetical protein|nr:hypothetical protein [bacterium]
MKKIILFALLIGATNIVSMREEKSENCEPIVVLTEIKNNVVGLYLDFVKKIIAGDDHINCRALESHHFTVYCHMSPAALEQIKEDLEEILKIPEEEFKTRLEKFASVINEYSSSAFHPANGKDPFFFGEQTKPILEAAKLCRQKGVRFERQLQSKL